MLLVAFNNTKDPRGDRAALLLARFSPEVVPLLVQALTQKGDDAGVHRRRALITLANSGDGAAAAVPVLESLLTQTLAKNDPDRLLALRTVSPFASLGTMYFELPGILIGIAEDRSDPLRIEAIKALASMDTHRPDLILILREILPRHDDPLRPDAIDILGAMGPKVRNLTGDVVKLLRSDSAVERGKAAYAVVRLNPEAPRPTG